MYYLQCLDSYWIVPEGNRDFALLKNLCKQDSSAANAKVTRILNNCFSIDWLLLQTIIYQSPKVEYLAMPMLEMLLYC